VIRSNSFRLYIGIAISTLLFWPLPLLHGRKTYTLTAFAVMLPLQFPQAIAVSGYREPYSVIARVGLLLPRALTGLAMGFANMNFLPTLLDLFGASLMSENPLASALAHASSQSSIRLGDSTSSSSFLRSSFS
jgi:hypothetical protein